MGLPLDRVVRDPGATPVVWHYLSLRIADLPGMPVWPTEFAHLASPLGSFGWMLSATVGPDGLWSGESVTREFDDLDDEPAADSGGAGAVAVRPYDDSLVYANGHVLSTPGVVGVAGGPPIGLYPNPRCRSCDRLMWHVTTVQNYVREYGHGWRSLYLCEDCAVTTCTATNWN